MKNHVSFLTLLFLALLLVSCSGSDNPASPDSKEPVPERWVDSFSATTLYGNDPHCDSGDTCAIIQGPGDTPTTDWDTPWEDGDGNAWAVSCARTGNTALNYGIQFRFMGESISELSPVFTVDDGDEDDLVGDIRFPRIISAYFEDDNYPNNTDYTFVEVAIAFQWRSSTAHDWRIRVIRYGYDPDDFEDIDNIDYVWRDDYTFPETGYGDEMPDIAYDPRGSLNGARGLIYVVFTRWINSSRSSNRIYMDRMNRNASKYSEMLGYQGEIRVYGATQRNGYHPRIEIGKAALDPLSENWNRVIAYTGQTATQFKPHLLYQRVWNWTNTQYEIALTHWRWPNEAGGLPMVDIAPPGCNYGAIVWTQNRSSSGNDVTTAFIDTRLNWNDFHTTQGTNQLSSAFPSICCHDDTSGDRRSSISYVRNTNPSANLHWYAYARYVDADPLTTAGHTGYAGTTFGTEREVSSNRYGHWDSGANLTFYYGMSTSTTIVNDNYWSVWSGYTSGTSPDKVFGAYGYIW